MHLTMYMCSYLCFVYCFFFFKQKTAYEMRISDWSSDVCSSDLGGGVGDAQQRLGEAHEHHALAAGQLELVQEGVKAAEPDPLAPHRRHQAARLLGDADRKSVV